MTVLHALVFGVIQGLTEFLPISSSGHLIIIPKLLGWVEQPLVFDTTLHLATVLALLVCFWKDIVRIVSAFFKDIFSTHKFSLIDYSFDSTLGLKIIVSAIPVCIVGFFFGTLIESNFRSLLTVAVFLILGSVLMYIGEKRFEKRLLIKDEISVGKSFGVGLFQVLSLFPGMSRSGATISGSMIFGLDRKEATKFSFLVSIPVVLLAGLSKIATSYKYFALANMLPLLVAFVASFVLGLLSIKFLLRFVEKKSLYLFIVYRVVLAGVLLILML